MTDKTTEIAKHASISLDVHFKMIYLDASNAEKNIGSLVQVFKVIEAITFNMCHDVIIEHSFEISIAMTHESIQRLKKNNPRQDPVYHFGLLVSF